MKKWKICSAMLALAIAFTCIAANTAQAQSIPVVAVGSSAFFGASGIAAISGDPVRSSGPLCGTRFWTGSASAIGAGS